MSLSTILSSVVVLLVLIAASAAADIGFNESNPIRMVSDGLREVEESIVQILGQSRHVLSFARFTHRYGKVYENPEEIKLRFAIFKDNLDLIKSTNKKGLSYKLGVNQFADLTRQELKRTKLGTARECNAIVQGSHKLTEALLPETKDWREDGIISYVKDQGQRCGSSWAFSATGAIEAAHHQAFGKEITLSEQQLLDCSKYAYSRGCNGGLPSLAFQYIIRVRGLEKEVDYPYRDNDLSICRYRSELASAKVLDYVEIGDEDELKHAVGLVRPVSVAFEFIESLYLYKSGVYTDSHCGNTSMALGHVHRTRL